ncbi:MAG: adenine phosphoribosyltransferase [Candidatus Gracilibacteria bacterium]|nr:adenine phosphoribosyltransferase [Candidatus Gracilibacteria bacterium]
MELKEYIRDVENFPIEGIVFKDITPLLQSPIAFNTTIERFAELIDDADVVLGLDARGFLFAGALSYKLSKPLAIVRKKGKLPYETISVDYELEYGKNTFDIHIDAIKKGDKVVIIDDLLATGGTAFAACQLVEKLGGIVHSVNVVVDLTFLNGREKLKGYNVNTILEY